MTGSIPKMDDATLAFFESLVPEHPGVAIRPMFGQRAAFVNGNMFMGVFGTDVMVRLEPEDREALLDEGGHPFAPMGREMKEYVLVPGAWRDEPDRVRAWVARSLDFVEELPVKQAKPRKAKG
ncbi:MAG: TfoX/Sxy family protein [Actinomycetota bacterium]